MDDRHIVELFEQRDTAAIREIQDAYGRQLTAIAMAVLSDPQDAEECVSDGLLRAWNSIYSRYSAIFFFLSSRDTNKTTDF